MHVLLIQGGYWQLTESQIAEPEGILAFLPILEVDKTVPRGYESRTVEVSRLLRTTGCGE